MKKIIILLTLSIVTLKAASQSWSMVGFPYDNFANVYQPCDMDIDASGNIYVANSIAGFYQWDGFSWATHGGSPYIGPPKCIKHAGSATYISGDYTPNGTILIAKWSNNAWSTIPSPSAAFGGKITDFDADQSGNLYAVGTIFNSSNELYVAKWNGTSWSQVGGTTTFSTSSTNPPNCVKIGANGNVYVAGGITDANGYYYVAKWDGNTWSKVGTGMNFTDNISDLAFDASGNIYVSGNLHSGNAYYLAKCSNGVWSMFGNTLSSGVGNICVKGNTVYINDRNSAGLETIYQCSGSNWTELGTGFSTSHQFPIQTMLMDNAGIIYVAGSFGYVNKINTNLAISETTPNKNFNVYPSGYGLYTIKCNDFTGDKAEIEIYDEAGRELKKLQLAVRNGFVDEIIDLTNLPSGIYITKISNRKQTATIKLQKS